MSSPSNLRKLQQYLKKHSHTNGPAVFEHLVANTFSRILYLPLQIRTKEDASIPHRVIWNGDTDVKKKTFSKSPSGADSICFACGFYLLVESTLRHGANQWRREFVECLRHYDDFVNDNKIDKNNVYLAVVARKLHRDTYTGFKQKVREGYNIILLEASSLAKIWEATNIVFTTRHLDLRQLFYDLMNVLRDSTTFEKMKEDINRKIFEWKKDLFKREKTVFFGLRSYEAMKKAERKIVGTSDILLHLRKDSKFKQYMDILGGGDMSKYIYEGLLSEKLAYCVKTPDEDLFRMTSKADFRLRGMRLMKAVEKIDE